MKVLTVTEPWATLIAIGAKQIETRSWPTGYRGPIAIHASKGMTGNDQLMLTQGAGGLLLDTLVAHGINPHTGLVEPGFLNNGYDRQFLATCPLRRLMQSTRGCVIATGTLAHCGQFDPEAISKIVRRHGAEELSFGDFTLGRYGFLITDVVRLPKPIPAKGSLGFWEWEPPAELEGAA